MAQIQAFIPKKGAFTGQDHFLRSALAGELWPPGWPQNMSRCSEGKLEALKLARLWKLKAFCAVSSSCYSSLQAVGETRPHVAWAGRSVPFRNESLGSRAWPFPCTSSSCIARKHLTGQPSLQHCICYFCLIHRKYTGTYVHGIL